MAAPIVAAIVMAAVADIGAFSMAALNKKDNRKARKEARFLANRKRSDVLEQRKEDLSYREDKMGLDRDRLDFATSVQQIDEKASLRKMKDAESNLFRDSIYGAADKLNQAPLIDKQRKSRKTDRRFI